MRVLRRANRGGRMIEPKPRITRCKLCRWWRHSERYGTWFCAVHHHAASAHDGCTWGEEEKVDA